MASSRAGIGQDGLKFVVVQPPAVSKGFHSSINLYL